MTTETTSPTATPEKTTKPNGQQPGKGEWPQRVISNPNDVAGLVLAQLNNVNSKKDDLTIAIKGLADTTQQLVRAYADHTRTIQKLAERVKVLEGNTEKGKE
jgi:hypothetical protein